MIESLRNLAKSTKYLNLYARAKELSGIRLFNNESDFSYMQTLFMSYLETYSSVYMDLAMKEENISQEVIEDDIRLESYLLWKRLVKDKKKSDKSDKQTVSENALIFKRK